MGALSFAVFGIVVTTAVLLVFVRYNDTPVVRYDHHYAPFHQIDNFEKKTPNFVLVTLILFPRRLSEGLFRKSCDTCIHALWFLRVPDTKPVLKHKGFFGVFEYSSPLFFRKSSTCS